jgi:hypothetical protein
VLVSRITWRVAWFAAVLCLGFGIGACLDGRTEQGTAAWVIGVFALTLRLYWQEMWP